jgi:quinoprotein glucose dehydrogenase|tara:strand:+ start:11873 stop:13810 length:1938 start_codon:yes stop_codon:yes gene_type:complete
MRHTRSSIVAATLLVTSQVSADVGDGWGHYGGSEKGLQYSSADQINLSNVANLRVVWQFRTGEMGEGSRSGYSFQANPILARGTLYVSTGSGIIIALDPVTGTERWRFDPKLDRTRGTSETANRGVSSWIDPTRSEGDACFHRIYIGILDSRLISVDGSSGKPCTDFGEHGEIDLSREVRLLEDTRLNYQVTSPPVIVGATIISGSAIGDNRGVELELGIVRGFDARTGELRWRFDPIPRDEKDPMYASWNPQEAKKSGAANAWAPLAADSELGLVYVPTGSVSPDYYGGEREGDNRYANSLVALRADSGAVVWHQQLVHHDVWDYDLPAQPTLADLKRDGDTIPAVIQATKMGMLFTFNRVTGEPIFDIEERPVPQSGVPGEHLSKSQPFPVAPPPIMSHNALTAADAYGFVLFDKWDCADQFEELRSDGIYTPPSLEGSVIMPSYGGGMNWGGLAFDPDNQIVVVNTMEMPAVVQLIKREEFDSVRRSGKYPESQFSSQTGTPYGMRRQMILSPLGAPCSAPPWGRLTAVDMVKGEIMWQVPFGTIEDMVPDFFPNLELGVPGLGGPIITAGGIALIGAAMDDYIRAFNLTTGEEVWKQRLPAGGQATPMTYVIEGKQYVVIAAGGHNKIGTTLGDYVIAFSL